MDTTSQDPTPRGEAKTARILIEVTAGLIPGTPEPEFTRVWTITSEEYEAAVARDNDTRENWHKLNVALLLAERAAVADEYARILRNPSRFNWTRTDWIWL